MHYINTTFLSSSGYTWQDVYYLLLIKQGQGEEISDFSLISHLFGAKMVKLIKAKSKADTELSRLRLDMEGKKFLEKLSKAEISDEHRKVADWLCQAYLDLGKKIGNKVKLTRHIRDFSNTTGIQRNCIVHLCNTFLQDSEQMEWSFCLEYVFWKSPNAFATRFNLENSRLWAYYQDKKEYFDKEWEKEKYQN